MSLLQVQQVSRAFGQVRALRAVSLTLRAGEVHALMGENGAGKSTFIRTLAGLERPDNGHLELDGKRLTPANPAAMQAVGLRFIHQELHPVRGLSVAENMFLDHSYPSRFGLVNWRALNSSAGKALARLKLDHINPKTPMSVLGSGDQMLVRIAATLIQDESTGQPWLYVMDEPTAALTGEESERLFDVVGELVQHGAGVLYVSHRMPEVLQLGDRVSVLRDGELISTKLMQDTGQEQIIHAMTGRDLSGLFPPREGALDACAPPVLKVSNLQAGPLRGASFELLPGEILGIGGLSGSGRGALLRALLGEYGRDSGAAELGGKSVAVRPADVWRQGIAYIPRERRSEGLMMGRSIEENIALPHLTNFARGRYFVDRKRQRRTANEQGERVSLKMTSATQPCTELSGGNQQKVLFGRALAGSPSVLMLDEPTRGVDIGARFDLYRIIRSLSASGTALILSSSDLPELIGLSDRIAIMQDGKLGDIMPAKGLTEGALLSHFYNPSTASAVA